MNKNLLSKKPNNLLTFLNKLGLDYEEIEVYKELLSKGSLSALSLSKNLKIARTKVYRILEKLVDKGFVVERIDGYGKKFVAEGESKIQNIMVQKEAELLEIKNNAPRLIEEITKLQMLAGSDSKIINYKGVEGLKQVTWNSTKVKGDFRIYEVNLLHNVVDNSFAEKSRREFAKRKGSKFMQLTNAKYLPPYTKVTEHVKQWSVRHIPKSILDIKFEIQIYNNVFCMFEYTEHDIFIVEIYNSKLAYMQKQIFDIVWKTAKPMKKIGLTGEAKA